MEKTQLSRLLKDIQKVRVAVLGDFCLDVYWSLDLSKSEPSVETGLKTNPIKKQKYSLGGAGNLVNNLTALKCQKVYALGVIGDDPWGHEMHRLFKEQRADSSGILVQKHDWSTLVYIKPSVFDKEQGRFDSGNFNRISDKTIKTLLAKLKALLPKVHIVIINQQIKDALHSPAMRQELARLIRSNPKKIFIVDSRDYGKDYLGAYLKLNDHEAARLCGVVRSPEAMVLREEAVQAGHNLFKKFQKPVFITRGGRGLLVRDKAGLHEIPAIQVLNKIDPLGAGDSTLAGISLALGAGRDPQTAAQLGSFTATVTIQKVHQTGTASPAEALAVGTDPDFIYNPELSEDPRKARFHQDTEIEIVTKAREGLNLTHAIFDHDGTISTLRQGWEAVMEKMMIGAILGDKLQTADESLYLHVTEQARIFIDKTTGIQTIEQMVGLVFLVQDFGCVPRKKILTPAEYKKIYNKYLLEMVDVRLKKISNQELAAEDFMIKNSREFLKQLRQQGVKLILASGTDQKDVEKEAKFMGYADLFNGGIYGSQGIINKDAKKVVLDRIMADLGDHVMTGLATFGDGPVEMRETRKRGGLACGVATDEIRRFGLNPAKRTRLIRAGADLIIPDFSQLENILEFLKVELS